MKGVFAWGLVWTATAGIVLPGCGLTRSTSSVQDVVETQHYRQVATSIDFPDVETPSDYQASTTPSPFILDPNADPEYWDLTLEEVVQLAFANTKVLRDLGGLVIRSPNSLRTVMDPAIQETDPRFGVAAALSAFDASFATSAFFENNDTALNNTFFGGGTRLLKQDANVYQAQITKRAATGTEFAMRSTTDYDANNAPGNRFSSAWNTAVEGEFRHPFLQGGGVEFNRIAGPSDTPGIMNGVMLARMNTDISLAEFEISVRDYISDVENVYWDLYFGYRDLQAKVAAAESALETWRRIHALYVSNRRGGEAEKEAQAREQYFRFREEVQNALNGRLLEGTRTNNGSSGGTFRGTGGVRVTERRLRLLIGLPINDGRLIRPAQEAIEAEVTFDWEQSLIEALTRRSELRRQKWEIKSREMELLAAHNFALPTLDAIGRYRIQGFGKDLIDTGSAGRQRFDSAYDTLASGDFQEWQLGMELSLPIGQRRAKAGIRNAELKLARARTILKEQERQVVYGLSNAVAEVNRAYEVVLTNYNSRVAAHQQLSAVQAAYESDNAPLDLVLEAQRRVADSETRYHRALAEHTIAVKNVHFEKGSLLDYNEVYLSEDMWPIKAYYDASKAAARRGRPLDLHHIIERPRDVSRGEHAQMIVPGGSDQLQLPPSPPANNKAADTEAMQTPPAAPPALNPSSSQESTSTPLGTFSSVSQAMSAAAQQTDPIGFTGAGSTSSVANDVRRTDVPVMPASGFSNPASADLDAKPIRQVSESLLSTPLFDE